MTAERERGIVRGETPPPQNSFQRKKQHLMDLAKSQVRPASRKSTQSCFVVARLNLLLQARQITSAASDLLFCAAIFRRIAFRSSFNSSIAAFKDS
jgi:hypothetical protein